MSAPPSETPESGPVTEMIDWPVTDPALFEAIEWHLLRMQLTPAQGRCLEKHGWFDVVWRAQWLVLRVYADRYPTVDAFQLEMRAGYLCSFDVRRVPSGTVAGRRFPASAVTPVGQARRVLEAHRRGALKALLEAAERVTATG